MTSSFVSGKNYFYVANRRFDTLVSFALEVASELANEANEIASVGQLQRAFKNDFWPGCGIELDKFFTEQWERKFWARAFDEVAWRVFERRLGNQEDSSWQVSVIAEARVISIFLTELVWIEGEREWHPTRPKQDDPDSMKPDAKRIRGQV